METKALYLTALPALFLCSTPGCHEPLSQIYHDRRGLPFVLRHGDRSYWGELLCDACGQTTEFLPRGRAIAYAVEMYKLMIAQWKIVETETG